jgi:LmbE family N-acetylglucosaminyl deacetylase
MDISAVLHLKLAALKEHKSQLGRWDPTEMVTGWAREQGARRGLAAAEAFRQMRLDES